MEGPEVLPMLRSATGTHWIACFRDHEATYFVLYYRNAVESWAYDLGELLALHPGVRVAPVPLFLSDDIRAQMTADRQVGYLPE